MSEKPIRDISKANNTYTYYDTQRFRYGQNSSNRRYRKPYNKDFQYSKYNYQPRWGYRRRKPPEREFRKRSPSPLSGTEEYTLRKIQKASDMIKKRLLMPPEADNATENIETTSTTEEKNLTETNAPNKSNTKSDSERSLGRSNKKVNYNVEEIHQKIISHITNLSHGRKVNLICANSSGYDIAIQQIQKQKRLELSKALRDMCSNQSSENTEVINAIMPDIGIKIEDLPLDVIQELSYTLDLNFDENFIVHNSEQTKTVDNEVCENDSDVIYVEPENVKQEVIEIDDDVQNEVIEIKAETSDENSCTTVTPDFNVDADGNLKDVRTDPPMDVEPENIKQEVIEITDDVKKEDIEIKAETSDQNVRTNPPMEVDTVNNIKVESSSDTVGGLQSPQKVDVCLQTEYQTCSVITQTCFKDEPLLEAKAKNVQNLDEAVNVMKEIDEEIARLTKLRQTIFTKLQNQKSNLNRQATVAEVTPLRRRTINKTAVTPLRRRTMNKTPVSKKQETSRKIEQKVKNGTRISDELNNLNANANFDTNNSEDHCIDTFIHEKDTLYMAPLDFGRISEKILVIQLVDQDILLAGTETGQVYSINTSNGKTVCILQVTTVPITCLCTWKTIKKRIHILVGSVDSEMREYMHHTNKLIKTTNIGEGIQCMEIAWDHVFIGTVNGNMKRYSKKLNRIEFDEKISKDSVLVLKATQEGARRVLLVGSRNAPVCIRDAMSGLHLRTMNDFITPTVYSLVLDKSMVYCGTTFHDILVFSFHDGYLIHKHQAANSKGISCLKVVENLLYASCFNGNIYVYSTKRHDLVGVIEGPGGVIISMEVLKNIVIVGTLSFKFKSILIPEHIIERNNVELPM